MTFNSYLLPVKSISSQSAMFIQITVTQHSILVLFLLPLLLLSHILIWVPLWGNRSDEDGCQVSSQVHMTNELPCSVFHKLQPGLPDLFIRSVFLSSLSSTRITKNHQQSVTFSPLLRKSQVVWWAESRWKKKRSRKKKKKLAALYLAHPLTAVLGMVCWNSSQVQSFELLIQHHFIQTQPLA